MTSRALLLVVVLTAAVVGGCGQVATDSRESVQAQIELSTQGGMPAILMQLVDKHVWIEIRAGGSLAGWLARVDIDNDIATLKELAYCHFVKVSEIVKVAVGS